MDKVTFSVGPLIFVGSMLYVWACAAWTHEAYWLQRWTDGVQHALVNVPFLVRWYRITLCCSYCENPVLWASCKHVHHVQNTEVQQTLYCKHAHWCMQPVWYRTSTKLCCTFFLLGIIASVPLGLHLVLSPNVLMSTVLRQVVADLVYPYTSSPTPRECGHQESGDLALESAHSATILCSAGRHCAVHSGLLSSMC